ncbi:PKD domain-containing protein [Dyella tabacisoli]|uniref:PKD domain-containing protein n=2 Tax=Dyella tabacisoli TaxID=2282381 RepID=A0A369UJS7_9GAMM|nr:PKD domain-containing protein [Dyella tabacisoli]
MRQYSAMHGLSAAVTGTETLSFGGGVDGIGVTSGTPKVYLVVYGNQWGTAGTDGSGNTTLSNDADGAVPYLQKLFKGLGTGGELWSGTMTQYCDGPTVATGATSCPSGAPLVGYPTGGPFAGIWYDNSVASPASATGAQLAQEAINAAQHFGNTTAASNRYAQYVILSPSGTTPDGFNTPSGSFCAWHDWNGDQSVTSPVGDIAFTNMPYVADAGSSCGQGFVNGSAGTLDGFSIVEGHEYAETITDQNPAGGWTNTTGSSFNGQENGDECAWLSSGQGASANVTTGTGTFAMQSTWSNDTNQCEIAHPIVGGGGGGGGTPTANFSFVANGLAVNFTDSSTDSGGTITSHSWNFGDSTSSTATSPSHTYAAAGTYSVTETVTDSASGKSSSKTQSVSVSGGGGSGLQNGVPVTGLAGAQGQQLKYTVQIPAGAKNLTIAISGGTGDADLYVKFGSAPTLTSYNCRPYLYGNNEHCTFATPKTGTYYIMLNGYAAFSGVTLKATWN